ncbi:MAG: hypothetical protein RLY43_1630 [Bacteroidota bacterium]|jgi:hypothetical protein
MPYYFLIPIKTFIDLFASGRSYAKVVLFFVFFLYVGILFYFRKNKEHTKVSFRNISFAIVSIILVLGVGVHLWNSNRLDTQPGERILYLSQTEITSSELTHIHELKGSFGMFDSSFHEGIDMGGATIMYVPHSIFWLSLVLLLSFLISYGYSIYRNEYKDTKTTVFFGFVFFILIKNAFDGGLLNYEVSALALFLLTYVSFKKKKGFYILIPFIFILFVGMFSFYFFRMIETYLFICALYSLLFLKARWVKRMLIGIILLLVALNALPNILYVDLKTDGTPTYIASFVQDISLKPLYRIGNMSIYKETTNTSVKELLEKYEVFDNQRPISIEWKTCMPNVYEHYSFFVHSEQVPSFLNIHKNDAYELSLVAIEKDIYKADLRVYSCFAQRFENQVQEGLREINLLPSIVYRVVDQQK